MNYETWVYDSDEVTFKGSKDGLETVITPKPGNEKERAARIATRDRVLDFLRSEGYDIDDPDNHTLAFEVYYLVHEGKLVIT